jgi:hypothetical protein
MASSYYNLNSNDQTLILDTQATFLQPFNAGNWTDLRFTMACSLTKQSDPNDPTGLAEVIGAGEPNNQFHLGFKKADGLFPNSSNFFGVSTKVLSASAAASQIVSASGFNNVTQNGDGKLYFLASNGSSMANSVSATGIRFQNAITTPTFTGYATLLMLRLVRYDPTSNYINSAEAVVTGGYFDNGTPFGTDTSIGTLRTVTAAAAFTPQIVPFTFSAIPDSLYAYYPFMNSRLRIHSYVLERYA